MRFLKTCTRVHIDVGLMAMDVYSSISYHNQIVLLFSLLPT